LQESERDDSNEAVNTDTANTSLPVLRQASIKLDLVTEDMERRSNPAAIGFRINYDRVKNSFPKDSQLIKMLAYTYADKIPTNLSDDLFDSNGNELLKALVHLESLNMMSLKSIDGERYVYIHRDHQDVIKAILRETNQELDYLMMVSYCMLCNRGNKYDPLKVLKRNIKLMDHCYSLISNYKYVRSYLLMTDSTHEMIALKIAELSTIIFDFLLNKQNLLEA